MFKKIFLILSILSLVSASSFAQLTDQQFADLMKKYISTDSGRQELGGTVQKYFMELQKKEGANREKQEQADMETQFKNPLKVDVGNAAVKGSANAKVTIVEFTDFQCPFCKRGADNLEEILKAYPSEVKIALKHMPLPMHSQAKAASYATIAAGKQGKLWEYYAALFANQQQISPAFFEQKAKDLALNIDQFKKDMDSAETKAIVEADMKQAEALNVNATPAFFVNGVAVRGAYPAEHFKKIIDRHLGKK